MNANLAESDLISLFAQKEYSKVIEDVIAAGTTPSTDPASYRIYAADCFSLGRFEEAFSILTEIYSVFSTDIEFLSLYGVVARRIGKFDASEQAFKSALAIAPNSVHLKNNYSNLLIDKGDYTLARAILNEVLVADPTYADAKANLNRLIFLENQNISLSASQTNTATDLLDPLDLAFSQAEVNYTHEIRGLKSKSAPGISLPLPSNDSTLTDILNLARKALESGSVDHCLNVLSKYYNSSSSFIPVYGIASDCYLEKKSFINAELMLLHSALLTGPDFKSYINLASFAAMRNDLKLAHHYLSLASSIDPSNNLITKQKSLFNQKREDSGFSASFLI